MEEEGSERESTESGMPSLRSVPSRAFVPPLPFAMEQEGTQSESADSAMPRLTRSTSMRSCTAEYPYINVLDVDSDVLSASTVASADTHYTQVVLFDSPLSQGPAVDPHTVWNENRFRIQHFQPMMSASYGILGHSHEPDFHERLLEERFHERMMETRANRCWGHVYGPLHESSAPPAGGASLPASSWQPMLPEAGIPEMDEIMHLFDWNWGAVHHPIAPPAGGASEPASWITATKWMPKYSPPNNTSDLLVASAASAAAELPVHPALAAPIEPAKGPPPMYGGPKKPPPATSPPTIAGAPVMGPLLPSVVQVLPSMCISGKQAPVLGPHSPQPAMPPPAKPPQLNAFTGPKASPDCLDLAKPGFKMPPPGLRDDCPATALDRVEWLRRHDHR